MISRILKKDQAALVKLASVMKPKQRLIAFFNHSWFIRQLYQAGQAFRKTSASVRNHKRIRPQR